MAVVEIAVVVGTAVDVYIDVEVGTDDVIVGTEGETGTVDSVDLLPSHRPSLLSSNETPSQP